MPDWTFEPEHLRSHHFLTAVEPAPACVTTHGCTYERRPPTRDDFFAYDRTKDAADA